MLLYSPISAVGACSSKIIACSNKIYAYSNVYTTAFNLNMKTVKKAFMMEGGRAFFWYDEARRVFCRLVYSESFFRAAGKLLPFLGWI